MIEMQRKPDWLRKKLPADQGRAVVEEMLKALNLNTICSEALCPNYPECFAAKTATFMILGTSCTRDCRFCNVHCGAPLPVDAKEPERIGEAVRRLGLHYVVITSVTRDDLPDGGAAQFAETVAAIRRANPETAVETLTPDFRGNAAALARVVEARPAVISHNMETVAALYPEVRPQADYRQSLALLRDIRRLNPEVHSKSGVMLGLGETKAQLLELFGDLREAGCEFLTIGQYLAPTREHLPVRAYIHPDQFAEYGALAKEMGFSFVASAPFVRSSYHAGEALGIG
jgi:lipoic acid synthetase